MAWTSWIKEKSSSFLKVDHPKDLPSGVGRHIVVNLKHDPDWAWSLKMVSSPKGSSKDLFNFRIFDPESAREKGVEVKDYTSLDNHPEAIVFKGWYHRDTWDMEVIAVNVPNLEPLAQ